MILPLSKGGSLRCFDLNSGCFGWQTKVQVYGMVFGGLVYWCSSMFLLLRSFFLAQTGASSTRLQLILATNRIQEGVDQVWSTSLSLVALGLLRFAKDLLMLWSTFGKLPEEKQREHWILVDSWGKKGLLESSNRCLQRQQIYWEKWCWEPTGKSNDPRKAITCELSTSTECIAGLIFWSNPLNQLILLIKRKTRILSKKSNGSKSPLSQIPNTQTTDPKQKSNQPNPDKLQANR